MIVLAPAALAMILVFAGLFGLVIGSFLNVVIYRVPARIPLTRASRCPNCGAPIRAWQNIPVVSWLALRGRCASCRTPISPRYPLVELATGVAFVVVSWWFVVVAPTPGGAWSRTIVAVAFLYLAAVSIALTMIDLDTRRLPNSIVLPSYVVLAVLFTAACLTGAPWGALLRAGIGMVALYLFYLVLRLIRPAGMGGGDVKLAGVIGLALGWLGWAPLIVGAFAAFALGGVFGIVLVLMRRAGRKTAIPFGPWMILGAWTGVFAGEALARWYIGLITG
jgi:leader peptidase (prepilin peptidase) / N-methyltransferase